MDIKRTFKALFALCLVAPRLAAPARAEGVSAAAQITALNMAVVSVRHITAARDRLVLDQEYDNVINNLSLGDLDDTPELTAVYSHLLDTISVCRLSDEERLVFAGICDARRKNALNAALSGTALSGASPRKFFASLFSCGVSAYFGVRRELAGIRGAAGEKNWELRKESLAALNDLQKELLSCSWALLRRHGLSDRERITQEDLDCLEQAMQENEWSKASQMFALLRGSFESYPPFWFYYADAAYRGGDAETALACLDEYDRRWVRVLRRDPCRARADRIRILLDDTLPESGVRERVARIRENTSPRDWLDNLFCGTILWTLGDREESQMCVRANVLFKAEETISAVVLRHMARDSFDRDAFCADLRAALGGERGEKTDEEMLSAWLDGDDAAAARLAAAEYSRAQSALSACLLWLGALEPGHFNAAKAARMEEAFAARLAGDAREAEQEASRRGALAARGNARACLLLGVASEYGWGAPKDPFEAARRYHQAAEAGNAVAQERYARLCQIGDGVTRDEAEALRWYRAAAARGCAGAHYQLGRMLRAGQGVARDLAGAAENFLAAARAGHAGAQAALGELYGKGAGVPLDYYEAYKWSVAASLGGAGEASRTMRMIEGRGALRKRRLDAERLERARREGRDIYARTLEQ